jgi:hypothetical protein
VRFRLSLILVVFLSASARPVFGQQSEKARVTGAAVVSVHNAGESDCPYMCNPFGGTAPGVVVGVQVPSAPSFRVGFEAGFERSIEGGQSQRVSLFGNAQLLTAHRDTTVSGLLTWAPHPTRRAAAELVIGGTTAFRHTVRHTVSVLGTGQPQRGPWPDVILDDNKLGVIGGVDIPVRLSPRMFLIPTLRVHYLFDDDRDQDGVVKRGIGPVITRLGIGVGVGF